MQEEKKAFAFAATDGKRGKPILFIRFINEEIPLVSSFYTKLFSLRWIFFSIRKKVAFEVYRKNYVNEFKTLTGY